MWETVVQQYSKTFSSEEITKSIHQAKVETMRKIIRCIVDEQIYPVKITKTGYCINLSNGIANYDANHSIVKFENDVIEDPLIFLEHCLEHKKDNLTNHPFILEIENHLIHQALSYLHCSHVPKSKHPILSGDQWVITGHNIHPCSKTKLGMPIQEVMRYAPEYNQPFKLNWIMVKKSLLFNNLCDDHMEKLKAFSEFDGEISDDYYLVPVHPYQYQYELASIYESEIKEKSIIMLDHQGGVVKSTSSFRTVCPLDHTFPMIKLPINSQMTSTVRSISNNSVMNSKNISTFIDEIYEHDPLLKTISSPMAEFGGMTYCHSNELKQRNLSFILRENHAKALQGKSMYTATCLFERDHTGTKIYQQLINKSQLNPYEWFENYIQLLIKTTITLMTKYGVGLEAHMQNISVCFQQGSPVHLFIKDYGGVRIDISRTGNRLKINEGHTYATTNSMHEKVQNTLILNHISTIISHLVADYPLEEVALWKIVCLYIQQVFEQLSKAQIPWLDDDFCIFNAKTLKQKALMSMRLTNAKNDIYIEKENPLYAYIH